MEWGSLHLDAFLSCVFVILMTACGKVEISNLPDSKTLGHPRGYRMARVITHYHSPYSFDACDQVGLSNNVPNPTCLVDLRKAVCSNRIDYLFLSDHPDSMQKFDMQELLLKNENDTLLFEERGLPYANQMSGCDSGFVPTVMAGFEGKVLSLGMTQHLSTSVTERTVLYGGESFDLRMRLRVESDAIVWIPHTESRSLETIQAIAPDGIEIYNIHANLDPKIRKKFLNRSPFEYLPSILTYLVDPYRKLHPDYMFLHFVEIHPTYFEKWNRLVYAGSFKVAGFGGTDSHENIFPQIASDGERLDSGRRMTRFMSNHLLVHDLKPDSIKNALRKGQGWLVFEGFGSPMNMDFSARPELTRMGATEIESVEIGPGEEMRLKGQSARITVRLPVLHDDAFHGSEIPMIRIELKKVIQEGKDLTVATSENSDLSWVTSEPGAYRAEIWIKPLHLRDLLDDFPELIEREYRWIVTNHLYLEL